MKTTEQLLQLLDQLVELGADPVWAGYDEAEQARCAQEIPRVKEQVIALVDLAVRAEREACAKLAKQWADNRITSAGATGCLAAHDEGLDCTAPEGIASAILARTE